MILLLTELSRTRVPWTHLVPLTLYEVGIELISMYTCARIDEREIGHICMTSVCAWHGAEPEFHCRLTFFLQTNETGEQRQPSAAEEEEEKEE